MTPMLRRVAGVLALLVFVVMSVGAVPSASAVPQGSVVTPGPRVSTARPLAAGSQYGALSFSPKDRTGDLSYGFAFGNSQEAVIYSAAQDCYRKHRAPDCQTVVWVRQGYAAIARANSGIYGSGWGSTMDQADANALRICREEGGQDCHFIVHLETTSPSAAARGGGVGRVCFFRDRQGALGFLGHVGWAYRADNRRRNPWTYGATQGTGDLVHWFVPPGKGVSGRVAAARKAHSWVIQNSPWDGVKNTFKNGLGDYFREGKPVFKKGDYDDYRCRDTVTWNPPHALSEWNWQAGQGFGLQVKHGRSFTYWPNDNNCLTHSVETLRAYGASDLPSGATTTPNSYFKEKLDSLYFLSSTDL